jgi:hypothetical protein
MRAGAKSAHVPGTNPPQPNLRIRNAGQQAIRRNEFVRIDLVGTRLDIDGHEFAFVHASDKRPNIAFVDLISTLGEFFFTVAGLRRGHEFFLSFGPLVLEVLYTQWRVVRTGRHESS